MKQIQLKKFSKSRRSNEGSVEMHAETTDGEMVQINFTPEVSEQILWAILSVKGQAYANDWQTWPLSPDLIVRKKYSNGSIGLTFVQDNRAAVSVQLSEPIQQSLREALDMQKKDQSMDHNQSH